VEIWLVEAVILDPRLRAIEQAAGELARGLSESGALERIAEARRDDVAGQRLEVQPVTELRAAAEADRVRPVERAAAGDEQREGDRDVEVLPARDRLRTGRSRDCRADDLRAVAALRERASAAARVRPR